MGVSGGACGSYGGGSVKREGWGGWMVEVVVVRGVPKGLERMEQNSGAYGYK